MSEMPMIGQTYVDREYPERFLYVDKVLIGDQRGREVRGTVTHPGHIENGRRYATNLTIFRAVWKA